MENKHSEEFAAIAKRIPDYYSTAIAAGLFIFVSMCIILSYVIKVPEMVIAEVRVTSIQPPTVLKTQISGRINLLNSSYPISCNKGDYLAILENAANYHDVQYVKQALEKIDIWSEESASDTLMEHQWYLGEIESTFYSFKSAYQKYRVQISGSNSYHNEIKLLRQNIENSVEYIKTQEDILRMYQEQDALIAKSYSVDSILFVEKVILEEQMNATYMSYLNSQRQISTTMGGIQNTRQSIIQDNIRITNLANEYINSLDALKLQLSETYHSLIAQIRKWENTYVLIAPQKGTVELANIISNASFVNAGEAVFNLIYNQNQYYGIAVLPSGGSGDVAAGQDANIKLDLYPYQEYGALKGKVEAVSLNSVDKMYLVYISIPEGLVSETKKELAFAETMYGTVEIITSKKRLIAKIFRKIESLFSVDNEINPPPAFVHSTRGGTDI
jgi:hypothetical protein